ncbi:anti-sigma factor [Nocardioides sp. BP30]|uniref:anti-sigma factor n=1 Tax=Nocardioides sp. BP30 TaxID=3036374 RepID=UPI002469C3A7|nr:anti-sigma factor [Nocardioides sp. BP30]WGL51176.1 anti-sigma factor [Nocardioides sp. BP30]
MSTDIHALSGAYAIDALDDEERADFERHLADCPTCQAEVDGLREAATTLAELHTAEPPAALRQHVLDSIRVVRPLPPVVEPIRRSATGVRRRWIGLVAAAVVAIALGGAVWHPWTNPAEQPESGVLAQIERAPDVQRFTTHGPGNATVTVYRSVSLNEAAVEAHDLGQAPDGKVYQVWLQNTAGAMVPAGFLAPGTSTATALNGDASAAEGAGITVEPAGGSPAPTSDPVALVAFTT